MVGQRRLIEEHEWDNLIILDACRFDYFRNEYSACLKGVLREVTSPASCTIEWSKKVWIDKYDLTYISGWPCANSKGIPRMGYRATDHIPEIIDVWKHGWDDSLGTIPPWSINKAVREHPKRRGFVIHYMQPHDPYIGKTKLHVSIGPPNVTRESMADPGRGGGFYRTSRQIDALARSKGIDYLKQAYCDNLRLVLEHVSELIPYLDGVTVVTADHGELLRPEGPAHPCGSNDPTLRQVPWFVVE